MQLCDKVKIFKKSLLEKLFPGLIQLKTYRNVKMSSKTNCLHHLLFNLDEGGNTSPCKSIFFYKYQIFVTPSCEILKCSRASR